MTCTDPLPGASRTAATGNPVVLPAAPETPAPAAPRPGVGSAAGAGQSRPTRTARSIPQLDAGRRIPHGARRRFHLASRSEVTVDVGR